MAYPKHREPTARQQAYIDNRVKRGMPSRQAAIEAGYASTHVNSTVSKLEAMPHIRAQIKQGLRTTMGMMDRNGFREAESVLRLIEDQAFFDPADLANAEGRIRIDDIRALPIEARRAMTSLKVSISEDGTQTVECGFDRKWDARKVLADYHGLLSDQHDDAGHCTVITIGDLIQRYGGPHRVVPAITSDDPEAYMSGTQKLPQQESASDTHERGVVAHYDDSLPEWDPTESGKDGDDA